MTTHLINGIHISMIVSQCPYDIDLIVGHSSMKGGVTRLVNKLINHTNHKSVHLQG